MRVSAVALLVTIFSFAAKAAISSTTIPAQPATEAIVADMPEAAPAAIYNASGLRVAFVKPFYSFKASGNGWSSERENFERSQGLSIGYVYLPIRQIGFTADAAVLGLKSGSQENIARLSGNAAYALNKTVNFKGGVNVSNFTDRDMRTMEDNSKISSGIGFQASIGVNLTQNLGVDVGYSQISQRAKINIPDFGISERFTLQESGMEVALNGTF